MRKNEKAFAAVYKKAGIKYRGTYYYALGTGAHMRATACFMLELSKYGDIDESLKLYKDPEDERLSKESMEFVDNIPVPVLLLRPLGQGLFYKGT